jgi:hypothetical protein
MITGPPPRLHETRDILRRADQRPTAAAVARDPRRGHHRPDDARGGRPCRAGRIVVTDMVERKRPPRSHSAPKPQSSTHSDLVAAVRAELGESADVVFDCVAIQSTMNAAIGMALKDGTVVVVGGPTADVTIPLPIVQDQQIHIQGSATYLPSGGLCDGGGNAPGGRCPGRRLHHRRLPARPCGRCIRAASSGDHVKVIVAIN